MYTFKINKVPFHSIIDAPKKKVVIGLMDDEKTSLTSMGAWCFKNFPLLNQVNAPVGGFVRGNFIWSAIDQDSTKGIITMLVIRSRNDPVINRQCALERQTNIICDHIKQMMQAGFRIFELQTWKLFGMEDAVNVSPINLIECLLPFAQAQDIEISLNIPVTYVTADIERTYADHVTVVQPEINIQPKIETPHRSNADMPTALRKAYHLAQERKTVNKKPKKERAPRNEVVTGSFQSLGELLKNCHVSD